MSAKQTEGWKLSRSPEPYGPPETNGGVRPRPTERPVTGGHYVKLHNDREHPRAAYMPPLQSGEMRTIKICSSRRFVGRGLDPAAGTFRQVRHSRTVKPLSLRLRRMQRDEAGAAVAECKRRSKARSMMREPQPVGGCRRQTEGWEHSRSPEPYGPPETNGGVRLRPTATGTGSPPCKTALPL